MSKIDFYLLDRLTCRMIAHNTGDYVLREDYEKLLEEAYPPAPPPNNKEDHGKAISAKQNE